MINSTMDHNSASISSLNNFQNIYNDDSTHAVPKGMNLGTSIMAVQFADGVILGADSRTTSGAYIGNRVTDKLTPLYDPFIYCCRSGSAADTQALADIVHYYMEQLW